MEEELDRRAFRSHQTSTHRCRHTKAKELERKTVLLSWQNTAGNEDKLDYVRVFRNLGVRKMQLTCNTQNYSGVGYNDINDNGLTGFEREVVTEIAKMEIVRPQSRRTED
jgi:membrane dipeptidase